MTADEPSDAQFATYGTTPGAESSGPTLLVGPAEIMPQELLVVVEGTKCWMRPRDMQVLTLLASNAGRVLARDAIFESIWGKPLDPQDRSVDVSIRRLRSRLAEAAPAWEFLHTHHGRGYRFEPTLRRPRRHGRPGRPR